MNEKIGKSYWNEKGDEFYTNDKFFSLPTNHTFKEPIVSKNGFVRVLIDDVWEYVPEAKAYAKNKLQGYMITHELSELPNTHTLLEPNEYDSWSEILNAWQYDQERELPIKVEYEKAWRDTELSNVLNRIDQYEKDQSYAIELRASPFTLEQYNQLLQDRKLLSDYPSVEKFPFVERPKLSGLV